MSWYYAENNERRGPIEDAAFEALVTSGTIKPDTLVWRDGLTEWVPYSQAPSLVSAASASTASPLAVTGATGSSAAACSQCGRLFPADDMVSYESRYICAECKPVFFQKIKEGASVAGQREYAGFWIRFGAKFVDGIILNVAGRLIGLVIGLALKGSDAAVFIGAGVGLVINAAYVIYFTGKYGATPGKMACKIEVIRADGSPMTFGRATGRYFAEMLSSLTLLIGYIMAGFDEEKRALHDRICDTRVVRKQQ
jgi:uncharacterized RDD family membrane protein YckC